MDPFALGSLVVSKVDGHRFKKFWWKEMNWQDLAYVDSCKKQRISTLRSLQQLSMPPTTCLYNCFFETLQGLWGARATCLLVYPCNRILINPEEKRWSFDSNWSSHCKLHGFWASSGKWWSSGKPAVLQSGSHRESDTTGRPNNNKPFQQVSWSLGPFPPSTK